MNKIKIAVIIIVIIIVLYALHSETEDLFFPKGSGPFSYKKGEKGDGYGRQYLYGKGNDTDSLRKLLDRIEWVCDYEKRTVKWRRSLLMAILISMICLLVPSNIDNLQGFMLKLILIMVVIYFSFSYYYYHYEKFPAIYIKENIDRIKSKLKLRNKFIPTDKLREKVF